MASSSELSPSALPPAKEAALDALIGLVGDAPAADVLALAHALAPLPLSSRAIHAKSTDSPGLLRKAIDLSLQRDYKVFSLEQLESLARVDPLGADHAWSAAVAEGRDFAESLAGRLDNLSNDSVVSTALVHKLIGLCPPKELAAAKGGRERHSLGRILASRSKIAHFGSAPALAWAQRCGFDFLTGSFAGSQGSEPSRALLSLDDAAAWSWFLERKGNPDEDIEGAPLWEAWRERSSRRSGKLAAAVEEWAATNRSGIQEARNLAEYFERLSSYNGGERLRDRKDWAGLVDANGRTPMMALACHPGEIRSYWDVKKALPGVAAKDREGRSLWHHLMAHGWDAISGTVSFLIKHCPLEPDAQGRGLIASVQAMTSGSKPGERSSGFSSFARVELMKAVERMPDARLWLACPNAEEAKALGHWLAHGMHVTAKDWSSRELDLLAGFACALDPASLRGVDPAICSGLAVAICLSRDANPKKAKTVEALMARGGWIDIDPEREALMRARAPKDALQAFDAVRGALLEARELREHVDARKKEAAASAPTLRI
jgi:hypothetical protein